MMISTTFWLLAAALPLAYADEAETSGDLENLRVQGYLIWLWIAIVGSLLAYRWTLTLLRHVRKLVNMGTSPGNEGKQLYFSIPNDKWAFIKRHIIHAPIFRKRHNREFKLSTATNAGTLPSRLQLLLIIGYFATNAAFCAITINWHNKAQLYVDGTKRTGVVIATNMCILFLLAGRNNPLVFLLGISFDTYNLIHRWIGRIIILEAIGHVCFFVMGKIATSGSAGFLTFIKTKFATVPLFLSGSIAICCFVAILLQSPSAIRHAFYETFLHVHQLLAATATAALWVHLNGMTTQRTLLVAILFWAIERIIRFIRLIRNNVSKCLTKAEVVILPGDAVKVNLRLARPWKVQPGQHVYLYMPRIGLWTSHPFSIAWSQDEAAYQSEKELPITRFDRLSKDQTTLSLIVRRRTGFTNALYKKADKTQSGTFTTTAFVEGPYGNQSFQSYGTVMLFAAGVGITSQVLHVRDLVSAYSDGTCATRKVTLVWVIQSPEQLEWVRPWMTQILSMQGRRDILKVLLYISRPRSNKEIHSPSSSVQMFPGRPDVAALLQKEQDQQVGAMAVSVCATGSMADDVRLAVRNRQQATEIDFFEEAFTW